MLNLSYYVGVFMENCLNIKYLKIDSVSKTYKKGKVKANCNITASFYPNQIVALIGHNGSGKTTLLNQIIGNVKPDSGDIKYQESSLIKDTKLARNLVSMMPQFHAPLCGVTLRQSIESILPIHGITGKEAKKRVDQILSNLNIEQWAHHSGDKLSGGLQRLTSFAMAVVCPAPIILLDEPTNDVDPIRRKLIWKYMRKLAQDGHIVVVVTHNLLEVEQYADRFILLDQGKIIQDASTRTLNQHFASNTLTAIINDLSILENSPQSLEFKYLKEELKIVFTLSSEQVIDAVSWILNMVNDGKVINYRLTSTSLDQSYGGMTNGK